VEAIALVGECAQAWQSSSQGLVGGFRGPTHSLHVSMRLIHKVCRTLTNSLDKPWQRPPTQFAQSIKDDGSTPAKTSSGRRPLPNRLQHMITQTPEQTSVREYEGVHSWWWAAYDEALEDLRAAGVDDADLQKVDEIVVREEGKSKAAH
jgi:hypothetical protein